MPAPFDVGFMQLALAELALLAGLSALLGPWIVLRRLAFFAHASGMVTFPGLVLATVWGVPAAPAALSCALGYAAAVERSSGRTERETATGLLLVAALAAGAVLASDIAGSGSGVDTLLFGTLIGLEPTDLALTAAALASVLALHARFARGWLVRGFDEAASGSLGAGRGGSERMLLVAVALAVVVSLAAVGALLVSVLLVVPAATARLVTADMGALHAATGALAAVEGAAALWLADRVDVAVGPAIAVVAASVFAVVAAATALTARPVVSS